MTSRTNQTTRPSVAVYAIARDEEIRVGRWAASACDADLLLIADTGSSDDTVGRARQLGVEVREISVEPFRFDHARNRALALLPPEVDVCISLDLDEVLVEGWRGEVDRHWRKGAARIACWLEWRWSMDEPALRWTVERIHARYGHHWEHPVHERLQSAGSVRTAQSAIEIRHLRDAVAPRPEYLELLRLAVVENPNDARLTHMLANEARMQSLASEAHHWFRTTLELTAEPNERLHSMLMLSHLDPERREQRLLTACAQFEGRREPWCELARLHLERRQWRAALTTAHRALAIGERADDYLANPMAWGEWPDQIAAQAAAELHTTDWEAHHTRRLQRLSKTVNRDAARRRRSPAIDFVLVTYNDGSASQRISELLRHTVTVPYTYTVVDNTHRNEGWAAACNEGATRGEGELIAFIDQDIEPLDGWLNPLLDAFDAESALVVAGPRCLDGLPWPRVPVGLEDWVCGACMLVRRDFFVSAGGFDADRFPHEYAETDLERTAEARGYLVRTIEEAHVVHHYEPSASEQVLVWRAQGAHNQVQKWGLPLDPWGGAHEGASS